MYEPCYEQTCTNISAFHSTIYYFHTKLSTLKPTHWNTGKLEHLLRNTFSSSRSHTLINIRWTHLNWNTLLNQTQIQSQIFSSYQISLYLLWTINALSKTIVFKKAWDAINNFQVNLSPKFSFDILYCVMHYNHDLIISK